MRLLFLLLIVPAVLNAQQSGLKVSEYKKATLPSKYYQGTIREGKQWSDKEGEHIAVLSESGIYVANKAEELKAGKLYAYHFLKTDTGFRQLWRVFDQVEPCEVDVVCEFAKGSLSVKDLDNDGIAEISFIYTLACKGGVDPDTKKLILYEGPVKHAIRGTNTVKTGEGQIGGEKIADKSLSTVSKSIQDFVNAQWKRFGNVSY